MAEENRPELPKEIELKKKLIVCPKCGADIEIDLTIDITPITEMIGAFAAMKNPGKDEEK